MMFLGFGWMTPEATEAWWKREQERSHRINALTATGMSSAEAYMRASCAMECEERDAIEQAKLADIRENGT